jgi:hypothetical protein
MKTEQADIQLRATRLLERWANAVEPDWQPCDDDPSLGCFGPCYPHWGVQTNWNYAAALATLAARTATANRERWQQRALSALRYLLATHVTGHRPGTNGRRWGNDWISMLGIERAMHGLAHLDPALSPADRAALRRVLISEADWLLTPSRGQHAGVCGGLWAHEGRNRPESNIWSGCLLWRVAQLFPDEAHAAAWQEQSHRFLMNGVSIEADAHDASVVAGRPVSEWFAGANFFPHYALDHHGYLNVGYMTICASNAAILHFDLKRAGAPPPESLYHHQADLWQVLRRFVFGDGRLARLGGDTRVRYAYCQEYLLPTLLFAADRFRDPHALTLAERQLTLIEREAEASKDGTFYGHRLAPMRRHDPHYTTRLEADRASALAMLVNFLPLVQEPAPAAVSFEDSVAGEWREEAHGAILHRSTNRLASFAWRAHGLAQGLCVPPGDGSMAEWSLNLCPVVRFMGDDEAQPGKHRRLLGHQLASLGGDGFVTCGAVMEGVNTSFGEGSSCTDQAVTHLAFAALPDGHTCLCLQYVVAAADRVGYLMELKDLHLAIPNDLFNGYRRTVWSSAGRTDLHAPPEADQTLAIPGRWLNVDDRLGVVALYGGDRLLINRSATRRGGRYRSLFVEEVCMHVGQELTRCRPGAILADIGFAVVSGVTAECTAHVCGGAIPFAQEGLRGAWVDGANGNRYALVANFGATQQESQVLGETLRLAPGTATVRVSGRP